VLEAFGFRSREAEPGWTSPTDDKMNAPEKSRKSRSASPWSAGVASQLLMLFTTPLGYLSLDHIVVSRKSVVQ